MPYSSNQSAGGSQKERQGHSQTRPGVVTEPHREVFGKVVFVKAKRKLQETEVKNIGKGVYYKAALEQVFEILKGAACAQRKHC